MARVFLEISKLCAQAATASASLASSNACRITADSSFCAAQTPAPWWKSPFQLKVHAVTRVSQSPLTPQMPSFLLLLALILAISRCRRLTIPSFTGSYNGDAPPQGIEVAHREVGAWPSLEKNRRFKTEWLFCSLQPSCLRDSA